jgi:hypothetical protein
MFCAGATWRTAPARAPAAADWLRHALKRRGQWLRAPEAGGRAGWWLSIAISGAGGGGGGFGTAMTFWAGLTKSGGGGGGGGGGGRRARPLSRSFQNGCDWAGAPGVRAGDGPPAQASASVDLAGGTPGGRAAAGPESSVQRPAALCTEDAAGCRPATLN